MTAEEGDVELHRQLGLTDDELDEITTILGRAPNEVELSMYSIMWSEHCSYKSSRIHLARLPSEAEWVIVGPGENAGVVDIGDSMAAVLRIESHNHPSAVEPHQGAATGVGGIIRDILTMGARPLALADPIRFGPLTAGPAEGGGETDEVEAARNRYLTTGVISGISGYGNAVGVPTVAGEIDFAPGWSGNPLVNVFCLGVMPVEHLVLARAANEGDLALLLGSATGRDGIGGVSVLASAGFDESSQSKRPSVQVGDPFEEKRLIEACLALFEEGVVAGIQDLGGAGLTCATSETAANGGMGMLVDVARIPRREEAMTPAEVMASESQERMLAIVSPSNLDRAVEIARRWDVTASVIGTVVTGGCLTVIETPGEEAGRLDAVTARPDSIVVAEVPAASLSEGPKYERPMARPARADEIAEDDPRRLGPGPKLEESLLRVLSDPGIGDSSWIWHQYDHQLFTNTVIGPGGDATVLRVKGTDRGLAISTDSNPRFCDLDPRLGAAHAVAEAARNVSTAGARPLALVDCLNFGNPEHPEVMWALSETVDGIGEACRALDLPVVGGNVSLYNETGGKDIWPTPTFGVLGLIERLTARPPTSAWLEDGLAVYLLGLTRAEMGGSAWARILFAHHGGRPPALDLELEARFQKLLRSLVIEDDEAGGPAGGPIVSAIHDCSAGGIGVAVVECCAAAGVGVRGDLFIAARDELNHLEPHEALFSESATRAIVAVRSEHEAAMLAAVRSAGVTLLRIGQTGGDRIDLGIIDLPLDEAIDAWRRALPNALGR